MENKTIAIKATPVFQSAWNFLRDDGLAFQKRILIHQGGTRSGKTYNIIIALILFAMQTPGAQVSIVSETYPHLRRGAMKDFLEIMDTRQLFDAARWSKTEVVYRFPNGSYIEFFSIDNDEKVRGAGRDILFVNECNLISQESYRQLNLRTRKKVVIDYNPADEYHWIYEHLIPRDDAIFLRSTYLDNLDFLPPEQVREILRLKDEDTNAWRIYGEGLRGISEQKIFTNFRVIQTFPPEVAGYDHIIGTDFGFNNPSAIISCRVNERDMYLEQLLYESGLTNRDLINRMGNLGIGKNVPIYADSVEPARIDEIHRAGYNIHSANKSTDSVRTGIDMMKTYTIHLRAEDVEMVKEVRGYSWKTDRDGRIIEGEPVKFNDHGIDAVRYAIFTYFGRRSIPYIGAA